MTENIQLWPEDKESEESDSSAVSVCIEPDIALAVILLSAGCTPSVIKQRCGFATVKDARDFCRSIEVREQVRALQRERIDRVGSRAVVRLEALLADGSFTDIRALVAAIRAGLDLAGLTRQPSTPPTRTVRELSVTELNELIASTERELQTRISRPLPAVTVAR